MRTKYPKDVQESDGYEQVTEEGEEGEIKRTGVRWLPSVAKDCLHIGFCKFSRRQSGAVQGAKVSSHGVSR
jgi:hypothetical protein